MSSAEVTRAINPRTSAAAKSSPAEIWCSVDDDFMVIILECFVAGVMPSHTGTWEVRAALPITL